MSGMVNGSFGDIPIGIPHYWYAGEETIPENRAILNGQNLSRDLPLFDVWGTKYGVGDGVTTFGTPDDRDRAIMGYKPGETTVGQEQEDQQQGHLHNVLENDYSDRDGSSGGHVTGSSGPTYWRSNRVSSLISDGVNGTPRTGKTTHPRRRLGIPVVRIF